jgi:hypothetical protein
LYHIFYKYIKYLSCRVYYDIPTINNILHEKYDNCQFGFPKNYLQTDGATEFIKKVCNNCLTNWNIIRCCKCNCFCGPHKQFEDYDNANYCYKCQPLNEIYI